MHLHGDQAITMGVVKRVVSVSLGSSKRDKSSQVELLGEPFELSRVGTDGSMDKFKSMLRELDGKVDAIGIGGADIWLVVDDRRYAVREIAAMVAEVKQTPVVDGSGLKHTLEREAVFAIQRDGLFDFENGNVLLVSAADRYGMAQALSEVGTRVVYGDLMFALGLPIRLRSYASVRFLGRLLLPLVVRLPFQWLYPTGPKQDQRKPRFGWAFDEADLVCGDWHFILRYAPDRMVGKTVLTQSLRKQDLDWLAERGVARAIATTPIIQGETYATNVMEAMIVAHLGRSPESIEPSELMAVLHRLEWKPNVIDLMGRGSSSGTTGSEAQA